MKTIDEYVKLAKNGSFGEKYNKIVKEYLMIPEINGYYIEEIHFFDEDEEDNFDSIYYIFMHEESCNAKRNINGKKKLEGCDNCISIRLAISKYKAVSIEMSFNPNNILSYKDYDGIANASMSFDKQEKFETDNRIYTLARFIITEEIVIYQFNFMDNGFVVSIEFLTNPKKIKTKTSMEYVNNIMESIELINYSKSSD